MINQKIFIVNFNILYEILDEIKANLSFNIIKCESDDEFLIKSGLDLKNSLFIAKLNNKLLFNKNLSKKNFLDISSFPLPLNKLAQLINIKLIKLKFNYQSKINIKSYVLNLNSKFFSKNNLNLKLTEKEIEIILYLNTDKNKKNVIDLQKNIWKYSSNLETHTVETHIYRLRKKINDKFNDKDFIISNSEGYFI
jgi:hypothetical protein